MKHFERPVLQQYASRLESSLRETNDEPRLLKVLTLNIAHGRQIAAHQLFLPKSKIERNLLAIVDTLRREAPDICALQEVDRRSAWNGSFDHLDYLACRAGYACGVLSSHVRRMKLSYGTALLSSVELRNPLSCTLRSARVLPAKGFTIAECCWPGDERFVFDVVSLHLDFAQPRIRFRQVDVLIETVRERKRPVVMMGDFNATWDDSRSAVRRAAEELDLIAFEPRLAEPATFRYRPKRWDWILISGEMRFSNHEVLRDTLSDHYAVLAEISLICPPECAT